MAAGAGGGGAEDFEPGQATYLFDQTALRSPDTPPEDSTRLIWMFLALIRKREVDYAAYFREFGRSVKTFGRDVSKLRDIGEGYKFTVTRARHRKVALASLADVADPRRRAAAVAADTLRAVAEAFGDLVGNDILAYLDASAGSEHPFLRIATPQLVSQSVVANVYAFLRNAWKRRSRVRFRYPVRDATGDRPPIEERTVEPHLVTYYDGRYYLVAYDRRPRTNGWRQFALDRIEAPMALAGSFEPRIVPRHYRGEDAVGLFKTGPRHEVIVAFDPAIAPAIFGRRWQRYQRTASEPGTWPTIAFDVFDLGEAVRWAFGFGAFARIVAPPAAVSLARETAARMLAAYAAAGAESIVSESAITGDIA